MKERIKYLLGHRTFRNIGYLTIGNLIAQAIALVGAFYIPKLLGPGQYGIYNTVTAYVAMFTVFLFGGLNKIIIREAAKDLTRSREILEDIIGIKNLFSIISPIIAIIIVLFVDYEKGTKIYIAIFSISLILTSFQNSFNTIFQSHERMKVMAVVSVLRQLFRVPLAIGLLLMGYGILALIILQLVVQLLGVLVTYIYSKKIIIFNFFSSVKIKRMFINPGIRFSLLEFFGFLSTKVDIVMLSFLTSPQNVGIYALAYNLANKGLVLRNPISRSLFPYYSKKHVNNIPKTRNLLKHTIYIILPLIILIIPLVIFIKPIITAIIGSEFSESADIFSVLVFYLVIYFGAIPWGLTLQSTGNEKSLLNIIIITAFLNIALNLILFKLYGIIGIAYSTLFVEMTRLILTIIKVRQKVVIHSTS